LQINWTDKAFVFLNQYLDIAEAIDDGESSITVDDPLLSLSDIPSNLTVPKEHNVEGKSLTVSSLFYGILKFTYYGTKTKY
jgi:hypothetical protein